MRLTLVIAMLTMVVALSGAAQVAPDPRIEPFLGDRIGAVARIDLGKIDVEKLSDWTEANTDWSHVPQRQRQELLERMRTGPLAALRKLHAGLTSAGVREVYWILPVEIEPLLVIPLPPDKSAEEVEAGLRQVAPGLLGDGPGTVMEGAIVRGPEESLNWLEEEFEPGPRPDLQAALEARNDSGLVLAAGLSAPLRKEAKGALQAWKPMAPWAEVLDRFSWASAELSLPPEHAVRVIVQTSDPAAAEQLAALINAQVDVLASALFTPPPATGPATQPATAPAAESLRAAVHGSRVVVALDHELLDAINRRAREALDAQIAAYRAAGEPVLLEDFDTPAPPDDQNAAVDLTAAAKALEPRSPKWQAVNEIAFELPLLDREMAALEPLIREHQQSLKLVAQAANKNEVNWKIEYESPAVSIRLPSLSEQRILANFIAQAALFAHMRGDDELALQRIDHLFSLAEAVGEHPTLVGHLVVLGIQMLTMQTAEELALHLRISPDGAEGATTPEQVRNLIARLLADDPLNAGLGHALQSERMMQLDSGIAVAEGTLDFEELFGGPADGQPSSADMALLALRPLIRPPLLNDTLALIRYTSRVAEAAKAPDYPSYLKQRPDAETERAQPWVRPLSTILLPSFDRAFRQHYIALAHRRMVAVLLAARLYAQEHDGKLPESLEDLVPAYLPRVPLDPFAQGQPLKYRAGPEPIVYSVGDDGADDGGSRESELPDASRWHELDYVVPLSLEAVE